MNKSVIASMDGFEKVKIASQRTSRQVEELRSALTPTQWASFKDKYDFMPAKMRNVYLKAMLGRGGPRVAIKAHCQECLGWERKEITACTVRDCALWNHRPYQE